MHCYMKWHVPQAASAADILPRSQRVLNVEDSARDTLIRKVSEFALSQTSRQTHKGLTKPSYMMDLVWPQTTG